jgi:Integrase core domain
MDRIAQRSVEGRVLKRPQVDSLLEGQVLTEDWRIDYNMNRPDSAHGWLTPVEFVEAWLNKQQLQPE